ncbi:MAG: hypothetical protein KGY80_13380 [Candidatus Thorarchaeota archaeon]|nr:hypothetical protein [Candidatus Thorarchaeota archaeon]
MSQAIKQNKYFLTTVILSIILFSMTFGNLPGPSTESGLVEVDGTKYDFSEYGVVNKEQLALFNYLNTLVSREYQEYGEWEGWYAEDFHGLHHYVLAFMDYAVSGLFETTPGYRSDHYQGFSYDLIKKMNTTEDVWGNNSIEWKEWTHPSYNYVDYYYPNATDPNGDDVYTGGFRGPANIMWTGHYALMMSLYERSFNTGEMIDEISWFVEDWNTSLTTDGLGNPKEGGIWEVGLIPCEPYIVFVQCNSIPIYTTELYDNMYGTQYMESGMWDAGLEHANEVMQDEYDLFTDGYFVQEQFGHYYSEERLPDEYPGPQMSFYVDDKPKVSSYCDAWALAFLEYTQPEKTAEDYPVFMKHFKKDVSSDQCYMMDTYNNPDGFGTYDILGSLFSLALTKQQGDFTTLQRLMNFLYGSYNKVWNGRKMHFDTMSLEPFLQPVLAFGWLWATTPVTVKDLADARPAAFWDYPYISEADDENIWVYQAEWDPDKEGFILNVEVDEQATITFSNFDHEPVPHYDGAPLQEMTQQNGDWVLTLDPGSYQLVIT